MALTHTIKPEEPFQWLDTGGDGDLDLGEQEDDTAIQGDSVDLGEDFAEVYGWALAVKPAGAPTNGSKVRVALGFSHDDALFPGGLADTTGAVTDPIKRIPQLQELRPLVLRDATGVQSVQGSFRPTGRYVAPVIWLDGIGQDLDADSTQHKFIIWPLPAITD